MFILIFKSFLTIVSHETRLKPLHDRNGYKKKADLRDSISLAGYLPYGNLKKKELSDTANSEPEKSS